MVLGCLSQEYSPESVGYRAAGPLLLFIVSFTILVILKYRIRREVRRRSMADDRKESSGDATELLPKVDVDRLEADRPLAVFLIGGDNELGPHVLRVFKGMHRDEFQQILFVSVGVFDYAIVDAGVDKQQGFRGTDEAKRLKMKTRVDLDAYVAAAHDLGLKADCRVSVATNPVDEIVSLAGEISGAYSRSIFFVGKLVFEKPRWFHRFLYAGTSDAIRKSLEGKGIPVTVIPVVLRA